MKIVIPVSHSDVEHLPLLTDVILKHGAVGQHSMLLVPTPSCTAEAEKQAVRLRKVCEQVSVVPTGTEFTGGWPAASNNQWAWTVDYLDKSGNMEPWLWLEVDAVPMVPNWATLLQKAYTSEGRPFFGYVKPLKFRRAKETKTYTKPGEDMLMGVAIYPPGISRDPHIQPLYTGLHRKGSFAIREPFDMYLRWVFKHRGVAAANGLIVDFWRTCNYHYEGAELRCEPLASEEFAAGGVVPSSAILVHGVKDGSLQREILGNKVKAEPVTPEKVARTMAEETDKATPAPAVAKTPDSPLLGFVSESKRRSTEVMAFLGCDLPTAARSLHAIGYKIGNAGWVIQS